MLVLQVRLWRETQWQVAGWLPWQNLLERLWWQELQLSVFLVRQWWLLEPLWSAALEWCWAHWCAVLPSAVLWEHLRGLQQWCAVLSSAALCCCWAQRGGQQ